MERGKREREWQRVREGDRWIGEERGRIEGILTMLKERGERGRRGGMIINLKSGTGRNERQEERERGEKRVRGEWRGGRGENSN